MSCLLNGDNPPGCPPGLVLNLSGQLAAGGIDIIATRLARRRDNAGTASKYQQNGAPAPPANA
jgi:hypothetical protein